MKATRNEGKGLVYLPANVKLYQFVETKQMPSPLGDSPYNVSRWHELEKPMNVLVLETRKEDTQNRGLGAYMAVLYNSEKWYVQCKDVYEVRS